MNNKWLNKNTVFIYVFFIISLFSAFQLLLNNVNYNLYFHQTNSDSFMDLFNSVIEEKARPRGTPFHGFYPPLTLLFYRIVGYGIKDITYNPNARIQAFELRQSVYGSCLLLLHIIPFLLTFFILVRYAIKGDNKRKMFYSILLSFSGLIWNALERGNIIIYAFIFTFLFVLLYKQENKSLKSISYICLAIAVNIKYYPAVFGLLLLEKKDWYGILKCFISFIIIFLFSYFLVNKSPVSSNSFGVLSSIKNSLVAIYDNIINGFTWGEQTSSYGSGMNYSIVNLCRVTYLYILKFMHSDINDFTNIEMYYVDHSSLYQIITYLIFAIGIFSFFFNNEKWKKLAVPAFLCFYIPPTSWTYVLLFMIIPFLEFMNKRQETLFDMLYSVIYAFIFALLIIPYQLFIIPYSITGSFLLQLVLLLIMYLSLFFSASQNCLIIIRNKIKG